MGKKIMEVYPLLVSSKNFKNLFESGVYCFDNENRDVVEIIFKNDETIVYVNESDEKFSIPINESIKKLDLIFYCGETNDPNPDVIFKINNEYVLASPTDFMGEQIEDAHLVNVYPKSIGWKKNKGESELSKMTISDIKKSLVEKRINIESEEVEIIESSVGNISFFLEMPKFINSKAIFTI